MTEASGVRRGMRAAIVGCKSMARHGDVAAAMDLLAHSLEQRHEKLALYRFYYARRLLLAVLERYESECLHLERKVGTKAAMQLRTRASDEIDRLQRESSLIERAQT